MKLVICVNGWLSNWMIYGISYLCLKNDYVDRYQME